MKLLEYKAKELFGKYGVPGTKGVVIDSPDHLSDKITELSYPVVVKVQIPIGGRGKAGGIRFAENEKEAEAHCRDLLHAEIRGYRVNQLLITEKAHVKKEWYLSTMLDRKSKCPMILFSTMGGMDIEQVAKDSPEKILRTVIDPLIGVRDYMARYLLSASGEDLSLVPQLLKILNSLYRLFMEYSCMLCEINPLVTTEEGELLALDGKVDIDDSALFRLPDMVDFRSSFPEETLVKEASSFNFLYIPVDSEGDIAVMSNGSGMLMSCIDLISKGGMKVSAALDLGGGATGERIREAVRILASTPGVKSILINIFGGITRCDEVALGIKLAMDIIPKGLSIVLRMEGTNRDKGLEIAKSAAGDVEIVPDLRSSVKALFRRRDIK